MSEIYEFAKEGDLFVTTICDEKFAFRKWTWGEKNALSNECTHVDPITGFINFDSGAFNEQLIIKTVLYNDGSKFVSFTIEEIRGMDAQLGDRLFRITQKLNTVSKIEIKNL